MGCCATPFEITDIDEVWPRLVHRIPRETPDPDGIRLACLSGEAVCLASPDGAVVLTVTGGAGGIELFVLLCVGFRRGAFKRAEPAMHRIADYFGAAQIVFVPRRRGWARMLTSDWSRSGDAFTCEVHHGR